MKHYNTQYSVRRFTVNNGYHVIAEILINNIIKTCVDYLSISAIKYVNRYL